jgi:hypothetical protein
VIVGAELSGDFVKPDMRLLDVALDDARLWHWPKLKRAYPIVIGGKPKA